MSEWWVLSAMQGGAVGNLVYLLWFLRRQRKRGEQERNERILRGEPRNSHIFGD